jgi:SAM-dependent methyltransferase
VAAHGDEGDRARAAEREHVSERVRVDLGCGNARREGFVGLDQFPGPQVDEVLDLTADRYPFDDDSVDEVFSAHFLEHIDVPNHVFEETGRICKDGARIEFWTPYAFTNEAFLYGHVHGITEEMWLHLGLSHRDAYLPLLRGRWQLDRFVFVVDQSIVDELTSHGVDLDFAIRYYKGVVHELGVEITYRADPSVPPTIPERVYASTRWGERRPLTSSARPLAAPGLTDRAVHRAKALGRRLQSKVGR